MAARKIAKIAVSAATFEIDKPYSYRIPTTMLSTLQVGIRVLVPFGRGNKKSEGIVLSIEDESASSTTPLKMIFAQLDVVPMLDPSIFKLIFPLKERYFCTCYDLVRAMLPPALGTKIRCTYEAVSDAPADILVKDQPLFSFIQEQGSCSPAALSAAFAGAGLPVSLARLEALGAICKTEHVQRKVKGKVVKMVTLHASSTDVQFYMDTKCARSAARKDVLQALLDHGELSMPELQYLTGATAATLRPLIKDEMLSAYERDISYEMLSELPLDAVKELNLTEEQQIVCSELAALQKEDAYQVALLQGVTGSGKTEVYISLILQVLEKGQSVILLVPEIALTPQMASRFSVHFGEKVALLHSALTSTQRLEEWKRIKDGAATVVIGTRSAVFAPVVNLGLIILDEEHEKTYKSENAPRYHAREVAKLRCFQQNALLLLGSATPSIESYYYAKEGKYSYFTLTKRYMGRSLPEIIVADMRQELKFTEEHCIGTLLREEILRNKERGEQTILYLNRRGYHRSVQCLACCEPVLCKHCSVPMTYHAVSGRLMCHLCGHSEKMPILCPACSSRHLYTVGAGTQRVEAEIAEISSELTLVRMDADTLLSQHSHAEILASFTESQADILLGTQMVAKGLDFPNVTLVGVLDADMSMFSNDFRSGEQTFSTLLQVTGRSGRGEKPGRAIIQTVSPNHPVIQGFCRGDYAAYADDELELRRLLTYPPYCDLVRLRVFGQDDFLTNKAAKALATLARTVAKKQYSSQFISVLGSAPSQILRQNERYRYEVTIKMNANKKTREYIAQLLQLFSGQAEHRKFSVIADINAYGI